jgi:lysozyme family protein
MTTTEPLSARDCLRAARFNLGRPFTEALWKQIQTAVGGCATGVPESDTAQAIARYQAGRALKIDGMVGAATLAALGLKSPGSPSPELPEVRPVVRSRIIGYRAFGGGRVDDVLARLRRERVLRIDDADIEMLQRMANVETGGRIQALNSWDSAHMSMGFMQWPIRYNNGIGKLQRLIQRAPEAFSKYGIFLEEELPKWRFAADDNSTPIRGAKRPQDLRSRAWAERFYRAGLDDGVIAAEALLALVVTREALERIKRRCGAAFAPYYDDSIALRALIQETFNHRPVWLYEALSAAIKARRDDTTERFTTRVQRAIVAVYTRRGKPQSGKSLVFKTGRRVL